MNIYMIKPHTKEILTTEFDGQITSIYTYFEILQDHIIYTNAQHTNKNMFFIGEQLFIGDALILGLKGFEETDITIKQDELQSLISYDVNLL